MPESTLSPVRDFVFCLCTLYSAVYIVYPGWKFTHPSKFHLFLSLYFRTIIDIERDNTLVVPEVAGRASPQWNPIGG
jgi:hypothetical protein